MIRYKNILLRLSLIMLPLLLMQAVKASNDGNNTGITVVQSPKNVTGRVVDEQKQPLPGVNVLEKGTTNGTITDKDGNYTILVPENATLVFSFIGYLPEEATVAGKSEINMSLIPSIEELEQVVVIGYGTVEKRDLTGSVASVSSEDMENSSLNSVDQVLQGRVAGVVFNQSSGQPGGESTIRIRGNSSINASNDPLYVIDGIPIVNDAGSAGVVRGAGINPLSTINPDDIESVSVMKDASAAAIYGARGANGVIIITTKKGKKGPMQLTFNSSYGIQEPIKLLDVMNAKEYATIINESQYMANKPPLYTNLDSIGEGTNWQKEILRAAPTMNYNLSANGGNETTNYSISASYLDQDGIIIQTNFKRYAVRLNLESQVSKRFRIGTSTNFTRVESNGAITDDGFLQNGAITTALRFNPMLPVRDSAGNYTYKDDRMENVGNPVAWLEQSTNQRINNRAMSNIWGEYEIIDGLKFKTRFSADAYFNKENLFVPPGLVETQASNGDAAMSTVQALTWVTENMLHYNKNFNDNNRFEALLVQSAQGYRQEGLMATVIDFPNPSLGINSIGAGLTHNAGSWTSKSGLSSFAGRVNYILKNRYIFTFNGRYDGSSKFGPGNKYGFFPSGAFAWNVSDEPFMAGMNFFNDLKFRSSYGLTGNEGIPTDRTRFTLTQTEVLFDDKTIQKGYAPDFYKLANPNLKWESTAQLDLGIDATFLNNIFNLTADFYQKKTTGLLLNVPVNETSGFGDSFQNIGDLQNTGFEFALNADVNAGVFTWKPGFNFSLNRNKVLDLKGNDEIKNEFGSVASIAGDWQVVFEGKSLGTFYGYVSDGIVQESDNLATLPKIAGNTPAVGDRKYKDFDGDGNITDADKRIIGNANPDFTFGFTNNFNYRGFDLSVFIQGSVGNKVANFNRLYLESLDGNSNDLREVAANRWTQSNPSNEYPRVGYINDNVSGFSDVYVEDGSYIRLKNVSLGYTFDQKMLSIKGIKSIRLYATFVNLLTLTKYSGYDPELNHFPYDNLSQGADYGGYPSAKAYNFGIKLSF